MKNISYLLVFFIFFGCGYEPMYSKKSSNNIQIKKYIFNGDKNINRKLKSLLNLRKDKNQEASSYELILDSKKLILTAAKDSLGNTSIYKTTISVNLILRNLTDENKTFKSKEFSRSFSYNNMTNKFDLSQYQETVETNLVEGLAEEITIFINS